jgi:hypothetical protein
MLKERQKLREEDVSSSNDNALEIERESTRSHSLENSLWKRIQTCHKRDYVMIGIHIPIST